MNSSQLFPIEVHLAVDYKLLANYNLIIKDSSFEIESTFKIRKKRAKISRTMDFKAFIVLIAFVLAICNASPVQPEQETNGKKWKQSFHTHKLL